MFFCKQATRWWVQKSSNHEMTWLNPQLQNFHFYQSDKFSAKSLSWTSSSSQCWRLSWCFFLWELLNRLYFLCYLIPLPFFDNITLKMFYAYYGIFDWLPFSSVSHLIHSVIKSEWLKRKSKHLLMSLVISRVATINQTLNHFTIFSCQSMQYVMPTIAY